MQSRSTHDRRQAQSLRRNIQCLIHGQLQSISPWWLISYHYRDKHTSEAALLEDVGDLKRKLCRILYRNRDRSIKGAGNYPYPKMLFFHETSHQGTGQLHTHLITEQFPVALNNQVAMEKLFRHDLPHKVKALSRWKSVDIQRINQHEEDYRRLSSYLGKQADLDLIAFDPFNSDISSRRNRCLETRSPSHIQSISLDS